jgi:RHS repeat-associated protein
MRSTGTGTATTLHWVLPEANNNIVMLTDYSGAVQKSYAYDAYGNTTPGAGTETNSQQYTGRENDGNGLYYYRNRYYLSGCMRFISEDPIGWASGQTSGYAYVGGNPVQFVDAYGLFSAADLPSIPNGVVDFSAGLGDALLWGTGGYLRNLAGAGGVVDTCSGAYSAGGWASFAFGASRLAYAGVAKVGSIVAVSGVEASAFRQAMKGAFRFGMAKNWRPPNLAKYTTDAELRYAAGKTNAGVNTYALGVAVTGAAEGVGAGCP